MAFNDRSQAAAPAFEKAVGFVNLTIARKNPDGSSGSFKLVGIPLRAGKPSEKALLDWIQKDPDNINKLTAKLQANFQLVNAAGAGMLCLED